MKIIVGLGNPGIKYETTRHNVGFLAIDRLIDEWKAKGPEKDSEGEIYSAIFGNQKILLVKPQTFMNVSGKCVGPLFRFYKSNPDDLIVIHDDVDLKAMNLRVKTGGGTAGHNGLKSIDAAVGSNDYHRIRVGIGRPEPGSPIGVHDYVLQPFTDEELKLLDPVLNQIVSAAERIVLGDVTGAMNKFNKKG